MIKVVNAAKASGLTEDQIYSSLENGGLSKDMIYSLIDGVIEEWWPSAQTMSNKIDNADAIYGKEYGIEMERRVDLLEALEPLPEIKGMDLWDRPKVTKK